MVGLGLGGGHGFNAVTAAQVRQELQTLLPNVEVTDDHIRDVLIDFVEEYARQGFAAALEAGRWRALLFHALAHVLDASVDVVNLDDERGKRMLDALSTLLDGETVNHLAMLGRCLTHNDGCTDPTECACVRLRATGDLASKCQ